MHIMKNKICIGTGLISLDILMRNNEQNAVSLKVGGTCGNVIMILAHMGWNTYPIARLDGSSYSQTLIGDMIKNGVHTSYVTTEQGGGTPIIIQHNIVDKDGNPTHKFTFRNNKGGFYLDYKPITKNAAKIVVESLTFKPDVFFFDRVNAATVYLSEYFKSIGTLVIFEPSIKSTESKQFKQCVMNSDIIKFSDQRINDINFTEVYEDKLFIQTCGDKGLRFKFLNFEWVQLPQIPNDHIIDTAGAGDWTTAALINLLSQSDKFPIPNFDPKDIKDFLMEAQKWGSMSCSYEGARGMMEI